jgi:uncharacterized protein YceH (UPF0502 family)
MQLSATAQRVLGSLIEKEMATPQSYPLSLNALTAAANQSTNRDPVTAHPEDEIAAAVRELSGQGLLRAAYARRSSTPKYEHQLGAHLEIGPAELAVLAVLLLRGPQTAGELRQRTDRLHPFGGLGEVQQVLDRLAAHHFGALVEEQPRQPGQKEVRWHHLLGLGASSATAPPPHHGAAEVPAPDEAGLAAAVDDLRRRVAALEDRLAALDPDGRRA